MPRHTQLSDSESSVEEGEYKGRMPFNADLLNFMKKKLKPLRKSVKRVEKEETGNENSILKQVE